jgi:hypothetical protein
VFRRTKEVVSVHRHTQKNIYLTAIVVLTADSQSQYPDLIMSVCFTLRILGYNINTNFYFVGQDSLC